MLGYSRNNYPASMDDVPTTVLGVVEHKNYLSRLLTLARDLLTVRKTAVQYDVIHCFGLDALLFSHIALAFKSPVKVYQVQDIRSLVIGTGLKARLLRALESHLLKKVQTLVVSSPAYFEHHFKRYYGFPSERTFILENKLEQKPQINPPQDDSQAEKSTLHIGYFGVLRCPVSISILSELAQNGGGRFKVYLRGKIAVDNFSGSSENLEFGGPYKAPDDLSGMYSGMDLIWAAYPYGHKREGNWQWARTVRFYESCAYGLPVIVQEGTVDADFVRQHDIGLVVDMADPAAVIAAVQKIDWPTIKRWKANLAALPSSHFVNQGEHERLLEILENPGKNLVSLNLEAEK